MAEYTLINCPIFWDHLRSLRPRMAQSIEDQVAAQLAASGIDPATASQTQIDAALNSVLVAAVEAQLGGSAATASSC